MITKLGHVTVLVRDYDEALKFYTEVLGLEKRADVAFGPGMRWLTVAPAGQKEVEIVLLQPGGMHDEATTKVLLERVGQGTAWVLETEDCHQTHETLKSRGVKFISPPEDQPWGLQAIFEDLYGNQFVLLQPKPYSP